MEMQKKSAYYFNTGWQCSVCNVWYFFTCFCSVLCTSPVVIRSVYSPLCWKECLEKNASFTICVLMIPRGRQVCLTSSLIFKVGKYLSSAKKVVLVMLASRAQKLPRGFSRAIGSKCPACRSKSTALLEPMYIKSVVLHWTLYFSCLVLTLLTVKQPNQSRWTQSFLGEKQENCSNLLLCEDL